MSDITRSHAVMSHKGSVAPTHSRCENHGRHTRQIHHGSAAAFYTCEAMAHSEKSAEPFATDGSMSALATCSATLPGLLAWRPATAQCTATATVVDAVRAPLEPVTVTM